MTSGGGGETMIGGTAPTIIDHEWYNGDYNFNMATGATQFGNESYTEFEIALMGGGDDSVSGQYRQRVDLWRRRQRHAVRPGGKRPLDGGTGNDTLDGGLGNDVYFVESTGDVIQNEIAFSSAAASTR